jgi:RNA polymerase sigma factor (sigma-70 family)
MLATSDYLRLAGATSRLDPDRDCDALHDAYVELHDVFDQVGTSDLTLLVGRAKYRALDRQRRRTRDAKRRSSIDSVEAISKAGDDNQSDERLQRLSVAIARLTPAEQALIALHWADGLSIPAIAARNNVPAQTLYSQHKAALRTLRSLMSSGEA